MIERQEKRMKKCYGVRVAAKLTGAKQTTVWLSEEQQSFAKQLGVNNQQLAQISLDVLMGFLVNINPTTNQSIILDETAEELTPDDKKRISDALAKEYVKFLPKEGDAE